MLMVCCHIGLAVWIRIKVYKEDGTRMVWKFAKVYNYSERFYSVTDFQ